MTLAGRGSLALVFGVLITAMGARTVVEEGVEAPWSTALAQCWSDPLQEAHQRLQLAAESESIPALEAVLVEGRRIEPRRAKWHLYESRRAASRGDHYAGLQAARRAGAAGPAHGYVQAEIARYHVYAAIRYGDPELVDRAAESFAVAVGMGHAEIDEALVSLSLAGATLPQLEAVAGDQERSWARLLGFLAQSNRVTDALAAAVRADRRFPQASRPFVVTAHLRCAMAARERGEPAAELDHFEQAATRATDPLEFALDHAVALLANEREHAGLTLLHQATAKHDVTAERLAGSVYGAARPREALRALQEIAAQHRWSAGQEGAALAAGWLRVESSET